MRAWIEGEMFKGRGKIQRMKSTDHREKITRRGEEVNEGTWIAREKPLIGLIAQFFIPLAVGPYFLLHANLSEAGSLAQSTVIAFHTRCGITLLLLQIIVENVVLYPIPEEKNEFEKGRVCD